MGQVVNRLAMVAVLTCTSIIFRESSARTAKMSVRSNPSRVSAAAQFRRLKTEHTQCSPADFVIFVSTIRQLWLVPRYGDRARHNSIHPHNSRSAPCFVMAVRVMCSLVSIPSQPLLVRPLSGPPPQGDYHDQGCVVSQTQNSRRSKIATRRGEGPFGRVVAAQKRCAAVGSGELMVVEDVPIPLVRTGLPVECGDARAPAQRVFAPQSPVRGLALRPDPRGCTCYAFRTRCWDAGARLGTRLVSIDAVK